MAQREWTDKNYYADLGVSSSAAEAEIKKAYRKLARDNHPDKHPGDKAAEERFKKAAEAYDVLGDPKKRKEYDEFKAALGRGAFGFGTQGGGSGFPGGFRSSTDFPSFSDIFSHAGQAGYSGGGAENSGFSDFIGGIFNTGSGSGQSARPSRGADVETEVTLDFRDAVNGTTVELRLTGDSPCSRCHGSGSSSGNVPTCQTCHGTGFVSRDDGAFSFSSPCHTCDGTGFSITDPCQNCGGLGTVRRQRTLKVRIPAGVQDGTKVRLAGQGEAGRNGKPAGDLFVAVHVRPDSVFTRKGDDLEIEVPVSFEELALGTTLRVPTMGTSVGVRIPPGTPDGRTLRVRGKGVEHGGEHGDLLVTVKIKVPTHLSSAAQAALKSYAEAEKDSGFDPRLGWAGNI